MAGSYLSYKIQEFLVESYDGENFYDMTKCVSSVEYFEDLFSPAIFVRMVLVNTSGELSTFSRIGDKKGSKSKYGLRGGERIRLKIYQPATKEEILLDEIKSPYYIYKISKSTTEYTRESLVIDLAPAEIFKNETSLVKRKYSDSSIDQSVSKILTDILEIPPSKIEVEKVQNQYTFYGNNRKPFTVLTWLAAKSIPGNISGSSPEKGTAGFLFYENKKGYHFKSLDTLFSTLESNSVGTVTYSYSPTNGPSSELQNFKIISLPTFEKNVNVLENLRIGMYSSSNIFFDLNTKTSETYVYNLIESYGTMKHTSSKNQTPEIPLGLQNYPSRLMVKLIDSVVANPSVNANPLAQEDSRIKYQSQSIARYNLAFSQVLNITIPLNLSLSVGDVINLDFGLITKDLAEQGLIDKVKSGKYLIQKLCHSFAEINGYTGLKLIRDSYGV